MIAMVVTIVSLVSLFSRVARFVAAFKIVSEKEKIPSDDLS